MTIILTARSKSLKRFDPAAQLPYKSPFMHATGRTVFGAFPQPSVMWFALTILKERSDEKKSHSKT
jgi:hypothetical protein